MSKKILLDPDPEVMIFKDDDGLWRILSTKGLLAGTFSSYEDAEKRITQRQIVNGIGEKITYDKNTTN